MNKIFATFLCLIYLNSCAKPIQPTLTLDTSYPIAYQVSMERPSSHYFDVTMDIDTKAITDGTLEVSMPVWTPGSYLIREYPKNIINFKATNGDSPLKFKKINKNTWQIESNGAQKVTVSYSIYSFELSVRTSFLDYDHGYINGASVFMNVPEYLNSKASLKVIPYTGWKDISTALPTIGTNLFEIKDFDTLVDSPIEIGNHEVLTFEESGVSHRIAMYSNQELEYDEAKVIDAYKRIVKASTEIVGEHPCKEYLFIIHHLPGIGGGLEHLFSTTCQTSPDAYTNEGAFINFMGLVAHEYFHLWNVKRIRPEALGPFNYNEENYTNMLWVSEGFTSYYQDDLRQRSGLIDDEALLNLIVNKINSIENQPGNKVQAVAESSWDAWIKAYRSNENSYNTTISYYTKGGVIANLLNLIIVKETNGLKNLDDVMKTCWTRFYKAEDRGFTDKEFQTVVEDVAGVKLDYFFENYIYGTTPIDYQKYFDYAGLNLVKTPAETKAKLGTYIRGNQVARVEAGSSADLGGLSYEDEIIEADGKEFRSISDVLEGKNVGDTIKFTVLRYGQKVDVNVTLKQDNAVRYSLEVQDNLSDSQKIVLNRMLNK